MSKTKSSSNIGVLIIVIGIALLLANMNILKLSMFWGIVKLWPFLLIIAGLSILLKGIKYIGVILWLGFIGVVIAYSYLNVDDKTWFYGDSVNLVTYTEDVDHLTTAQLNMDISHGSIHLESGEKLIYEVPETGVDVASFEKHTFEPSILEIKDADFKDAFISMQSRRYNITLPETGEWYFSLDGGILSGSMDFRNINTSGGTFDFGIGDLDLYLNDTADGLWDINLGVGDVVIEVPSDLGVKLTSNGGLTSIDTPDNYTKNNDVYYSKNYDTAKYKVEILLDIGIGSFEIK